MNKNSANIDANIDSISLPQQAGLHPGESSTLFEPKSHNFRRTQARTEVSRSKAHLNI